MLSVRFLALFVFPVYSLSKGSPFEEESLRRQAVKAAKLSAAYNTEFAKLKSSNDDLIAEAQRRLAQAQQLKAHLLAASSPSFLQISDSETPLTVTDYLQILQDFCRSPQSITASGPVGDQLVAAEQIIRSLCPPY